MNDEEMDGVTGVPRQIEAGETVDPACLEWATAVLHQEGMA
jgi:hypothetical protein